MRQVKFEFILRADQPIAHHSETFGNQAVSARRKVRQSDGTWAHVPVVSGDAMRHGMREASAYVFLDAAGLLHDGGLSEEALRLLFAGGQVTGSSGGVSKLNDYREMCDLVPPLALFGGCAQNRVIPGACGSMTPCSFAARWRTCCRRGRLKWPNATVRNSKRVACTSRKSSACAWIRCSTPASVSC